MSKRPKQPPTPSVPWRSRIVGYGEEAPEQLLANPFNFRIHNTLQENALGGVLREVGIVQNVLVNRTTGHMIDGHLRTAMAISDSQQKIPITYVELTEEEEKVVLATFDPLSAMAGKDDDIFKTLVDGMDDAFKALVSATGEDILNTGKTPEDTAPELPEHAVSRTGDLWLLGSEHRLLCGDATSPEAVVRVCGEAVPLLMVTDPPYGVGLEPEWREEAGLNPRTVQAGKVANDDRVDWSPAWQLFPGDVLYVWHAGIYAGEVAASLFAATFQIRGQIIWRKQHFVISRGAYHWQHEPCWYAVRRGKSAHWRGDRTQSTVWDVANLNPHGGNRDEKATGHGTQKPVELMRRPILNHTATNDYVYDPFLGSGTTMIACEQSGRRCLAIDIDQKYVDVAVLRWQEFTGREATLDGDGRTFAAIKAERLPIDLAAQDQVKEENREGSTL